MSLFNELQKNIIENPKALATAKRAREKRREREEIKTEKEIRMEMKSQLSEDEYKKWYMKREYEKRVDIYKRKYRERQDELQKMLIEICDELWPGNDLTDYDKFYADKFKSDDTWKHWNKYRFFWQNSKLSRTKWNFIPKWNKPFRVPNRIWMTQMINIGIRTQNIVYQYLKPYMPELWDSRVALNKKQWLWSYPVYISDDKLMTIAKNAPVNRMYVYMMFEAMSRNKYIISEFYLWRTSFLVWDVLITQAWNVFRPSLVNNLPWLNKDTVEELHKKRMDWFKCKSYDKPPIYIVNDAYLIKVSLKWENLFYIVPT